MNAVSARTVASSLNRACAALCLGHAMLVTFGVLIVWLVRSFSSDQMFAHIAEPTWMWALFLWPIWWPIYLIASRGGGWRGRQPLFIATAIWLMTAVPAGLLMWSLRGFR